MAFDAGSVEAHLTLTRDDFNKALDQAKADAARFTKDPFKAILAADGDQAKTVIADLQARKDKLGKDTSFKVAADGAQAGTELDKVQARKDKAGQDISFGVTADAAAANADLDKLAAKKAALGHGTETIKVKTDSDTSGLDKIGKKVTELTDGPFSLLKTAIIGLGPATIPVLGAVTAGIAPIAGALGSAAIGMGAFGEISSLVLNEAAKSANTVLKAQAAYNAAIASGTKQSAAYATEQKAITAATGGMSAAQVALVKSVSDVITGYHGMLKSVTPLVSSALVPWMKDVSALLQYIKPLITPIAAVFKSWGEQLGASLSGNASKIKSFIDAFGTKSATNIWSFGEALAYFAKGAGSLIHDIAPSLSGAAGGVQNLAASFAGWASSKQAADDIKGFFTWARAEAPEVKKFLDALSGTVGNLIKAMAYSGGGDLKVLTIALSAISALPPGGIVALSDAFIGFSVALRAVTAVKGIASLVSGIGTAVTGARNFAAGMGDAAKAADSATGKMGSLGGSFAGIGTKIGSAAAAVGNFSVKVAATVAKAVADFAVMAAKAVVSAATQAAAWVADAAVTVAAFLAEAAAATVAFVAENVATLGIVAGIALLVAGIIYLATHWKQVWGAIKAVIVDVWDWVKSNWPLLLEILAGPIGLAVLLIRSHWTTISNDAKAAWNAIKSFFTGWWNGEIAAWKTVITTVTGVFSAGWNAVESGVKTAWNAIKAFFTAWWNAEISAWKTVITTVTGAFKAAWNTVESDAKTVWAAIRSWFSGWWSAEISGWKTIIATVTGFFRAGWNGIYSDVKTVWGEIKSWFGSFWSSLESGFTTVIGKIKTIWLGFQKDIQAPVDWVITNVYDKYIVRFWNDVAGAVGLPKLTKLAEGGIVPGGYSPVDNQLVWMRSGEGVLQPGAVSALGGPGFIHWANKTYGDLGGGAGQPGSYALGGIVGNIFGDIGSFLSSPIREVISFGKTLEKDVDDGILAPLKAVTRLLVADAKNIPGGKGDGMVTAMKDMPVKMWEGFIRWVGAHLPGGDGSGGASGPGSAKGNAITRFAEQFLGTPYVFGGTSTSGWDCVAAGTLVVTARGAVAIESVVPGDLVTAWERGKTVDAPVAAVLAKGIRDCVTVRTATREVTVTPDHRLPVLRGGAVEWVPARTIAPGECVVVLARDDSGCPAHAGVFADGFFTCEPVASIAPAGSRGVYDLVVPGPENFTAGGILAHNCSGFTEFVYDHFGWTPPRTSEAQYNWVKRIADPVPGALAFFTGSPIDPPPGHVGIVTSPDTMIDAYGTGYGTIYNTIYGSSGAVMGFGIPPSGFKYDNGGWIQPGATMVVNTTGKPEPVLSGEQWNMLSSTAGAGGIGDKLDRIAGLLASGPRATAAGVGDVLNGTAHTAAFRSRYPRNR